MPTLNFNVVNTKSPFNIEELKRRFQQGASDWTVGEAYLCILIEASLADGDFVDEELKSIESVARRSRALKALSPEDLDQCNASVDKRRNTNPNAFKEACDALPPEMALSVYAHCVDIILSDGQLLQVEAQFLENLASRLRLQTDQAQRIYEALLVKSMY